MIANARSLGTGLFEGQITLAEAKSLIIRHGLLCNVSHSAYRVLEYLLTHFNRLEPSDLRPGFHRAVNAHDESRGADRRTCWPKQDRIAAAVGMSERTVKRAIAELDDFRILVVQRTTRKTASGFESRNRYAILFPSRWFAQVRMDDGKVRRGAAQAKPLTRSPRKPKAASEADTGSPPPPEAGDTRVPWAGDTRVPLKGIGQRSKTSMSVSVSPTDTTSAGNADPTSGQPDPESSTTANPPRAIDGAAASPAPHNADGALARADLAGGKPAEDARGGRGAANEAAEPTAVAEPPRAAAARQARSLIDAATLERIDTIHRRRRELAGWTNGGEDEPAARKAVRRAAQVARIRGELM